MRKQLLFSIAIFTLIFSFSIFAQTSDPIDEIPEECEEKEGATIDPDESYSGFWDDTIGDCSELPETDDCVVCSYVYN